MAVGAASSWGALRAQVPESDEPDIELELVSCPGCSDSTFETILTATDPLTKFGGRFNLVRCTRCSLVLTNPRPVPECLGYFYPGDYLPYAAEKHRSPSRWSRRLEQSALRCYYGYPKQPIGPLTWLLGRLALLAFHTSKQRHEWFPFRGAGRLLDVGCGSGVFLERMRDFGWTVCGLELAADVARRVQARTQIPIHIGTLPHRDFAPQSFDVVTMWHVLEHVPNPRQVLKSAAELLSPGGLLVVEVPNIESWSFARFGSSWCGLEIPRHFQHFCPQTLTRMLPAESFRNIEVLQIGARSLIKQSAERALANGQMDCADILSKPKSYFVRQADWTERTQQADVIRLTAEKI